MSLIYGNYIVTKEDLAIILALDCIYNRSTKYRVIYMGRGNIFSVYL